MKCDMVTVACACSSIADDLRVILFNLGEKDLSDVGSRPTKHEEIEACHIPTRHFVEPQCSYVCVYHPNFY